MSDELTIVITLLWGLAVCVLYRVGKLRGEKSGYDRGLARGKTIAHMIYEDAKLAGKLEAWSEINDRVTAIQSVTANLDDPQVH